MATELENSIKNAAAKVAQYVADVATMTVETKYVEIGPDGDVDFDQAKPAARTIIRLDGDSETVVPMRETETKEFEVDTLLFDLHQSNVTTAIDYRASMLDALLGTLKSGLG